MTETLWPAPKYCVCPSEVICPAPLYKPTIILPFLFAFRLASPIRVSFVPFTLKVHPTPFGMVIKMPSMGILLHTTCPNSLEK